MTSSRSERLLLFLYDELESGERAAMEEHLRECAECARELTSLSETLATVETARLAEMATVDAPGDWEQIRARLEPALLFAAPRQASSAWWMAKAAAILLLAGASFVVGRNWEDLALGLGLESDPGIASIDTGDGSGVPAGPETRAEGIALFTERTHGYLNRSRMVLLEFANTDEAQHSMFLRQASRTLLEENSYARRVAGEIEDQRLEELLDDLGRILREISLLTEPGDTRAIDRIRAYVNNSGVLDQLEILSTPVERLASQRSRV